LWSVKSCELGDCPDYATSHSLGEDLILFACSNLLGRTLASQVSLAGLAKLDLACASNLESLGDTFVRLLHDILEKRVVYNFFHPFDQA